MEFYRLLSPDQKPGTVVVVADDPQAGILLRWVPNTGLWHRTHALENDFLFGDDGGTYEPISPETAATLLGQVEPFDERVAIDRRLMTQYRALPTAEQRTNAEMGLTQSMTGLKTMSAPGLPELLRRSRRWRTLTIYAEGVGSAPRQFVSNWSRRDRPLGLAGLELRIRSEGRNPVVQARAVRRTEDGTDAIEREGNHHE